MIDLHCHILPGLDDGAATLDESVELARAYVGRRVYAVAATPHVSDDYPTTPEIMLERLELVRAELSRRSIPLQVLPGGEISLETLVRTDRSELREFGLAGNPQYLLLEFPDEGWPLSLRNEALELLAEGVTPVLAHPERNPDVQADPERLGELVRAGALVQLTVASLAGRFGRAIRRTATTLLDRELAHMAATDSHHAGERLAAVASLSRAVGDRALVRWMTRELPLAILNGAPQPPRPPRQRSGWRLVRTGRRG